MCLPFSSGILLFLNSPVSSESLRFSAFFFFSSCEVFSDLSQKLCCSSPGRELHAPVAPYWLCCSGLSVIVCGSLMNNSHARSLGCCCELLFTVGSPGSGGPETVQKEPTYTCEKLPACSPQRPSLTILSLWGGWIFQFSTLPNSKFFVPFFSTYSLTKARQSEETSRVLQQNKKDMTVFQIISLDYLSFTYLCVCVRSVIV